MADLRWVINHSDYEKERLRRSSAEALRKYYGGFKYNEIKRKPMFQDELNDLEMVYKSTLVNLHKQVEACLPSLLHYMEEFLKLHKQNEEVREKLDVLYEKTGKAIHDYSEEEDD